jgi:hypothetical protein
VTRTETRPAFRIASPAATQTSVAVGGIGVGLGAGLALPAGLALGTIDGSLLPPGLASGLVSGLADASALEVGSGAGVAVALGVELGSPFDGSLVELTEGAGVAVLPQAARPTTRTRARASMAAVSRTPGWSSRVDPTGASYSRGARLTPGRSRRWTGPLPDGQNGLTTIR